MKALTLTQPWATLIAIGAKRIETRSWSTNYRGSLAIHAAHHGYNDDLFMMKIEPFYSALINARIESRMQIPLGGIIAICNLVDVQRIIDPSPRAFFHGGKYWELDGKEHAFGDYRFGRYAWLLDDIQRLSEPIGIRGALGLWDYNDLIEVNH